MEKRLASILKLANLKPGGDAAGMPKSIYLNEVLRETDRLLSLEDREPCSKTFGCFDRTYWSWKFTDFPGARFQEGAYALAYLYMHHFPGNRFAGSELVLEWLKAAIRFWQRIQYSDGSFDEAYPFEHSLAATAFTSFYVGEAFLMLPHDFTEAETSSIRGSFSRAGDWLVRNDERHGILSNHLAAAAAALQIIFRICGDDKFRKRSEYFLKRIYDHQSAEGWYEEYGGADAGYQTHATFYLARIWQLTNDQTLLESLRKSLEFLKFCVHPDGTVGGEYGSRNTEFYFPAGLEILAPEIEDANAIAHFMQASVKEGKAPGLRAMDAYNFFPMLNNYLFAADAFRPPASPADVLPLAQTLERHFPDAGIFVKSNEAYYAVLGLSKGGVLKIYDRRHKRLLHSDCGYWGETESGEVVSSQHLKRPGAQPAGSEAHTVESEFVRVNQSVPEPWLFMGFRAFSLTLGRLQGAAYWVKNLLVHVLIRRKKRSPLRLVRRVYFEPDRISISDEIRADRRVKLKKLKRGAKFTTIHMGSARYFQPQGLNGAEELNGNDWAETLTASQYVRTERTVNLLTVRKERAV